VTANSKSNPWRRRWVRICVYIAVLVAIVLIGLPYAARYALEHWLKENGAEQANIKDIDINLFTGTVSLKGTDVKYGGHTVIKDSTIDIDLALIPFFSRQATVQSATLQGVHLEIEKQTDGRIRIGSVAVGGKSDDAAAAKQSSAGESRPWWFKVETLQLTDSTVRYISPQFTSDVKLKRVVLQNVFTGPAKTPASIQVEGQIDGAPVSLTATGTLRLPEIKASGKLVVSGLDLNHYAGILKEHLKELGGKTGIDGQYTFTIADGNLVTAGYDGKLVVSAARVAMDNLQSDADTISWQGKLDLAAGKGGGQKIAVDGALELAATKVAMEGVQGDAGTLSWKGKADLATSESGIPKLVVDGTLGLAGAKVATGDMRSSAGQLSWQGKVDLGASGPGAQTIAFDGTLASSGLGVEMTQAKLQARTKQVELKPAMKLQLGPDKMEGGGDVGIHAEDISVSTAQNISHNGGILDTSGKFQFATSGEPGNRKFDWGVQIPAISVTGGSVLNYTDPELKPPFKLDLTITKLSVKDIDSTDPEKAARFEFSAGIGKYGKVDSKGSIRPFAKDLFIEAETKLDNMSMVRISPYLIKSVGYYVKSGEFDLDSKMVIRNGAVDSKNKLLLSKLHLKKIEDGEIAAKTEADLGMPLDKALDMLRDKNDRIELDVPVTGKLNEINIGYNSVINIAMKKALKAGAMNYLIYAFQPYGSLIYLGQKIGEAAAKVSLDPIVFEAGSATLTDAHKDYLQKLVKVMKNREKIGVQLCSYVVFADALTAGKEPKKTAAPAGAAKLDDLSKEMQTHAITLAAQRAAGIKAYLVDEHGIDAGRLSVCVPEPDEKPDAKPRVELRI